MTPEERQIIQGFGQILLFNWIDEIPTTFFYGFLMPIAIIVAYQHPYQTWRSKCQLAVIWLGMVAFTGNWVSNVAASITSFQIFEGNFTPQHIDYVNAIINTWNVTKNWFTFIPPVINDAFIIWRAWVVFQRQRWALCFSITLCFCSVVVTLVLLSISSDPLVLEAAIQNNNAIVFLSYITLILSFLTNSVATSFIGWTLWKHMQFIKKNIVSQERHLFRLWHILYLLTDAGALYAILQLLDIVITISTSPNEFVANMAFKVIGGTYFSISTIYPALTIALIRGPFSIAHVHETVQSLQRSAPGV